MVASPQDDVNPDLSRLVYMSRSSSASYSLSMMLLEEKVHRAAETAAVVAHALTTASVFVYTR